MSTRFERYSRQTVLPFIGERGQEKISRSRILIIGCGALGTVMSDQLARAGVGELRLVDRDQIELSNLQRQTLYEEKDLTRSKAEVASEKLSRINSQIQIRPYVTDLSYRNIEEIAQGVHLLMDATDNISTRFLLNEYSVKQEIPLIYTGVLGTHGMSLNCLPPHQNCLRCFMEEEPTQTGSCELMGILGPTVSILASYAVAEAFKLILGQHDFLRNGLLYLDLWSQEHRVLKVPKNPECLVCGKKQWDYLQGKRGEEVSVLCGKNQVKYWRNQPLALVPLAQTLSAHGQIVSNRFFLKFIPKENPTIEMSIYPDGCIVMKGTEDEVQAKKLAQHYFG
ncbi:MAG: ThiF family adenylyltransferase [Planctomycetota bacterium]